MTPLNGIFRRRVVAEAGPGTVWSAVEDDLHHFEIELEHDGRLVTAARGNPVRVPWTTCPGAVERLRDLVGQPLSGKVPGDPRQACTHLFDLARVAMAQALRGGNRVYDIAIPDRVEGRYTAELRRDGVLLLTWSLHDSIVTAPADLAGADLEKAVRWPSEILGDPDLLEAALVLRRGIFVSNVRTPERAQFRGGSQLERAADQPSMLGVCYTYQPEQASHGLAVPKWIDFTDRPGDLAQRRPTLDRTAGRD